jgi:uncharacterized protein
MYRADSETCLIAQVRKTTNAWERMRGLLGRPPLAADEGLLIEPCPSVHTLGMRYALDIVFVDANYRVLRLIEKLPPLRSAACANARATLELAPGTLSTLGLRVGDALQWRGQ